MQKRFAIKVVREPKTDPTSGDLVEEKTIVEQFITNDDARTIIHEGMKLVAFWVALDTARKAILIIAAK